jgi:cephalosporin-C deacetylase
MQTISVSKLTTIFFVFLSILPQLISAQMTVKTDRPNAKYAIGESATFIVQRNYDGLVDYSIKYAQSSELQPLKIGTTYISGGQGYINFTPTEAGFVHCVVTKDGQMAYGGAAFDPFKIKPIEAEPVRFDSFWTVQKARLAAVPLSPNVYYRNETQYVTTYNYDIGLTDGRRAYGYMNVPKGGGSYPAVIQLPPYGNQPNLVSDDMSIAERGGVISFYLNIHNNQPSQNGPNAYLDINLTDSMNYYLKYAILGVVKTIDYLHTRADFNGQIGLVGVSQGGGLAILSAGIDNRVSLLVNVYPALCAHPNLKYDKPSGFPNYWSLAKTVGLDTNTVLKTVKYFDAVTAAKRFKGVSWSMIGYRDNICYPATSFEAYNQLKGQKILTHFIRNEHSQNPEEFNLPSLNLGMYAFFRRHFPAALNPPFPYAPKTLGWLIDAGKDTVLAANNPLILQGSVKLENEAMSYPVRWEKIEGTGTVTFDNPNNLTTTATFSQTGKYRLRFIAEETSTLTNESKYTTLSDDILVTINDVIPVELIDFQGKLAERSNILTWSTASERDNKSFELQRSEDAKNWKTIGEMKGKGTTNSLSNYSFSDDNPLPIAYYRLKQIDVNNVATYSKTIALKRNKSIEVAIFPNPANKELTLKINESVSEFDVKIYDVLGRIWLIKTLKNNVNILTISDFPKGNYWVEIKNETFFVVKKFVKN